jgi:uncharacterized protein YbaR (Trm112 family)
MNAELLKDLCCPETRQALEPASAERVAELNARIRAGQLRNRSGKPVEEPCEAALLREDGRVAYPVRRGLPILLIAEGLSLEGS